jgi:hypothetical protein
VIRSKVVVEVLQTICIKSSEYWSQINTATVAKYILFAGWPILQLLKLVAAIVIALVGRGVSSQGPALYVAVQRERGQFAEDRSYCDERGEVLKRKYLTRNILVKKVNLERSLARAELS